MKGAAWIGAGLAVLTVGCGVPNASQTLAAGPEQFATVVHSSGKVHILSVASPALKKTAAGYGMSISPAKGTPRVSVGAIIKENASNALNQEAQSIDAVYCRVSGVPAGSVNRSAVDPGAILRGQYYDNLTVWMITFVGIQVPIHVPEGYTGHITPPNEYIVIIDADTGKRLGGFTGYAKTSE